MREYRISFKNGTFATIRASCKDEKDGLMLFLTEDSEVGQFVYLASIKDLEVVLPDPLGPVDEDLII